MNVFHLLLLACAAKDADSSGGGSPSGEVGEGVLALTFAIDPDYQKAMDEEAVGRFWGSFWDADEVSSFGPEEGAVDLGGIYVEEVDLRAGPSAALFLSEPLPAIDVVVLGFLDSDANADPKAPDPDDADPVTVPGDNRFTVVKDAETTVEVYFGLLNP